MTLISLACVYSNDASKVVEHFFEGIRMTPNMKNLSASLISYFQELGTALQNGDNAITEFMNSKLIKQNGVKSNKTTCMALVGKEQRPCKKAPKKDSDYCAIHKKCEDMKEEKEPQKALKEKVRCSGMTKTGNMCKKYAVTGFEYCATHKKDQDETPIVEKVPKKCIGQTKKGNPCKKASIKNSDWCSMHSKEFDTDSVKYSDSNESEYKDESASIKEGYCKDIGDDFELFDAIGVESDSTLRRYDVNDDNNDTITFGSNYVIITGKLQPVTETVELIHVSDNYRARSEWCEKKNKFYLYLIRKNSTTMSIKELFNGFKIVCDYLNQPLPEARFTLKVKKNMIALEVLPPEEKAHSPENKDVQENLDIVEFAATLEDEFNDLQSQIESICE